jgi:hypothetical protein
MPCVLAVIVGCFMRLCVRHSGIGLSGPTSLLVGKRYAARRYSADKEGTVNKSKDLSAITAQLRALIARDDVGPDQKKHVEVALNEIKRLRRRPHVTQRDVYFCVRRVAESLLNAFHRD